MSLLVAPFICSATRSTAISGCHFTRFLSMEQAAEAWDKAAPESDIFLQRPYLEVLAQAPPKGMEFNYLVFYKENEPIGVALIQLLPFHAGTSMNFQGAPSGLADRAKRQVANWFSTRVAICGNMLLTGEHGFWFNTRKISPEESVILLEKAVQSVVGELHQEGKNYPVIFIKDIAPSRVEERGVLRSRRFAEFQIQPNMVMDLPFQDFEAYLAAMSTKYRTRAKRAFKKGSELKSREICAEEIQHLIPEMYHLYQEVMQHAGFNMIEIHPEYFLRLKQAFPEYFKVFGYFLNGELTGFYTVIKNGFTLEAHFLGYSSACNAQYQLYLNMLYDMVRKALEEECREIVFARTALEIKSSVGAEPRQLYNYIQHRNALVNAITGWSVNWMNPVEIWQPRHPFKLTG